MLLVVGAAVLGVTVLSFVRIAPDAGPGTAEAEPRRPWKLGAEPSPGVSATVVAVPSASPARASAVKSTPPTPSSPVGSSAEATPTRPTETPALLATPAAPRTTAPEASTEPEPPAESAPAPAPTPTPSSTPPPPDKQGVCVPVLGVCLELRGR
ncbi:hypothetical protein [Streptomyces sp. NPDC048202]|uniref:hypothetical protein n=1 Tax=Streptomyces sp. NPDC048202 TaxID=3365514 RepID=UPI00371F64C4